MTGHEPIPECRDHLHSSTGLCSPVDSDSICIAALTLLPRCVLLLGLSV